MGHATSKEHLAAMLQVCTTDTQLCLPLTWLAMLLVFWLLCYGSIPTQHSLENKLEYIQEVISGLKPDTSYEFTVTVNNGVSDQDTRNENLRRCELTTRTMEGS